jgi:hypothetical protein
MYDISQIVSHLSLQDQVSLVVAILSLLGTLVTTFSQSGTAHHNLHIVTQKQESSSIVRYVLLFLALCCLAFFIFNVRIEAIPPPSPKEQATALIKQFYADINQKDYQAAYKLTKDGFQQSLHNFADGFKYTQHDDISFESVEELPDQTIRVVITIKATEKDLTTGRRIINNYRNEYRVGEVQGIYKIVKGHNLATWHS